MTKTKEEARAWMRENGIQLKYKPPSRTMKFAMKSKGEDKPEGGSEMLSAE